MSAQIPKNVIEVFDADHMAEVVGANEFGPEIDADMAQRLIDLAKQRTQAQMDHSLDESEKYVLVMTTWDNFCRDTFGSSGSAPNRFALCTIDWSASAQNKAYLCKDAMAVQQKWIESGDSRCTQMEEIDQSGTDFHDETREFWAPKDYVAIVSFSDELVAPDAKIEDAM